MEEDKIYSELIRGSAIHKAPDGFTGSVMKKLQESKVKTSSYIPLIGTSGQILIAVFVIFLIVLGIVLGNQNNEPSFLGQWFSSLNLNLSALESAFSVPVLSILAAVFVLILFDNRYQHRKTLFN